MSIEIDYEWIPAICKQCTSFGHDENQCLTKQIWLPKTTISVEAMQGEEQPVGGGISIDKQSSNSTDLVKDKGEKE